MRYNTDIVIHKNSDLFKNLNDKLKFNYIDSYMISGVMGYINKYSVEDDIKVENPINIPRNVLQSRDNKLDYLWAIIYMLENNRKYSEHELIKKAFENNDEDSELNYTAIDRVKLFHNYAMGGIEILHREFIENPDSIGQDYVDNLIDFIKKYNNW